MLSSLIYSEGDIYLLATRLNGNKGSIGWEACRAICVHEQDLDFSKKGPLPHLPLRHVSHYSLRLSVLLTHTAMHHPRQVPPSWGDEFFPAKSSFSTNQS
jgi:hypothetical protein